MIQFNAVEHLSQRYIMDQSSTTVSELQCFND